MSNLQNSSRPFKILTKDGQRETLSKLVIPPNLLKEENVCLISRETEHPSKNNESIEPLTCLLRAFLTHNIALLWRGIASVYFIKGSLIFLRTLGIV